MKPSIPMLVAFLGLLSSTSSAAAAEPVWTIGVPDGRHDEFALGKRGGYPEYSRRFGDDVTYQVGRSKPAEDFPYIHPGPADVWAGSKPHTRRIRFDLPGEPSGGYLFTLRLALTHYEQPPLLTLTLNGKDSLDFQTPKDARGVVKLWKLPAGSLRAGANEIALRSGRGSWAEYDALSLESFPGDLPDLISSLRLRDTILIRKIDGAESQVVMAEVGGLWDGRGAFRVRAAGRERAVEAGEARLPSGAFEIPVGAIEKPTEVECELVAASGARVQGKVTVQPHRRWRIYAVMKTHYDLGYTHPVEEMLRNSAGPMLKKVMEYCDESRGNPAGCRFIWNYPSWLIGKIRELLPDEGKRRFEEYLRRGEISWSGLPFTLHSYFCGLEDIVRSTYLAADLDREFGTTTRWAKQTDVPGHTRLFPQVLTKSGIRLLQIGANNGVRGVKIPLLFHWESPDGSRILTQFTDSYGFGYDEDLLLRLERDPAYPCDAFLAVYITGDNVGPGDLNSVAALARDMDARYAFPRFQIGHLEDFVDHIERNFADRIPTVKAENTDWWIHGVASMARETALARSAREELTAAEKASAIALLLAPDFAYPAADFRKAYERSLLYSEHTWGMAGFKPKPEEPSKRDLETNRSEEYRRMRHSWEVKGDYARAAEGIARTALEGGLLAAARSAGVGGGTVLVFNPLNWPRSDLARVPRSRLPAPPFTLRDAATGAAVPWQLDGDEVAFIAPEVPPCGWAAFRAEPGGSSPEVKVRTVGEPSLEASGFRIAFDPKTGAAVSLRHGGEELVDPEAPFQLNQFVYEGTGKIGDAGWHGSPYEGPGTGRRVIAARGWRIEEGPVFARFSAEGALEIEGFPVEVGSVPRTLQTVTVARGLGWVECRTVLSGKRPSALSETGHVAFPFKVPGGKFRLELLGSVVDPEADLQEMGNRDCFAVEHWVDVSSGERGITWCPVEATITSLGDIRLFKWDPKYVPANARIYSNVFNNGWSTNFQEWQGGDFSFRYRLRPHAGDFVQGEAPRFGWETAQPLVAVVAPADGPGRPAGGPAIPARASFVLAESKTAVLLNLKRAEDGKGLVARLFETSGRPDVLRLSFPGRPIRAAARTLLTELPLGGGDAGELEVREGAVSVPVGAFAIETVRVEM